jgi:hypothetical protein
MAFIALSSVVVMFEVLYEGVSAWEQQGFMTSVSPAHQVRRRSVCPADLEYLCVVIGLTDTVPLDHDSVANRSTHLRPPSSNLIVAIPHHARQRRTSRLVASRAFVWRDRRECLGMLRMVPDDVVAHFIDVQEAHIAIRALMNVNCCFTHVFTKPGLVSRV